MKKTTIRQIVQIGLLIAMQVVLSRFLSISTPIAKIGFAFLPIAITGMLYGPVYAGLAGAAADLIGANLFPIGAYYPGFTLTATLVGVVYGLFLWKKPASWLRISLAAFIVTIFLHLGLNTVWLWRITGKGFWALLPTRIVQNAVMFPVQVFSIHLFCGRLLPMLFKSLPAPLINRKRY